MPTDDQKKVFQRTIGVEVSYMRGRVRKLAHQITRMEVCDDVGASILCRSIDYMGRSVGRRAQGAHTPTQGFVCVNGDYRLRVAQNPTYKVKDHKAHKQLRVRACVQAHARTIDASRRYTHMTAPYRRGGRVWSKLGGVGKKRTRKLLYVCDHMVANGEITAALELFRGV